MVLMQNQGAYILTLYLCINCKRLQA